MKQRGFFGLFKKAGANVSLSWQESGRELTMDEIRKAKEWLLQHMLIIIC
jgi:predicted esterase